jgi:short-subunit dehydrogenase
MVDRARGAIVLVGSAAGLHGGPNMTAYGGTKAFDIVFGEALWSEIHASGVDVLNLVIGATDTPAFRQLLFDQGITSDPAQPAPMPDVTSPEDTAAEAIANLSNGPTWIVGQRVRERLGAFQQMNRNDVVRILVENVGGTMQRAKANPS